MTHRSYTDDEFREAVSTSSSLREVATSLGLQPTSGCGRTLHAHARRLGLTLPLAKQGHRSWTDDQFREAVHGPPAATSLRQVATRLGLRQNGKQNQVLRRHAARLGIRLPNGWPERRRWI